MVRVLGGLVASLPQFVELAPTLQHHIMTTGAEWLLSALRNITK
jgi:hypothetical protein